MSHRHLVLGLLSESPMTGYDIRKRVCETMGMIASPSYGAVYATLHRLLEEGAVTVDVVPQDGRPSKKVYSLTEQGWGEFEGWLREPAASDQVKREFLLKVLLARSLEPDMLEEHLKRRRQETRGLSDTLERLYAQPSRQVNGHHRWVIEYALEMCEAEIRWLDRMERALLAGETEEEVSVAGPG